jgi:hypothetical protein
MHGLGRVKKKSREAVTSSELVLIPPSIEKYINNVENTLSCLQKNPARISPEYCIPTKLKNPIYLNPTYLFLYSISPMPLSMPSANSSPIIVSTRYSWKNPSGAEDVSGSSQSENQTMLMNICSKLTITHHKLPY